MSSSGAIRGYGSTVEIGVGATPTWTEIVGVESFDFPDQTPPDEDATHLGSPNDTEETIPGMKPVAAWGVDAHYVPGGPVDLLLIGLADTNELVQLRLTPAGSGATASVFGGYVKSWLPKGINPKSKMLAALSMSIMARITE
mgnify:CR=1 FL=1